MEKGEENKTKRREGGERNDETMLRFIYGKGRTGMAWGE